MSSWSQSLSNFEEGAVANDFATFTGNKALELEESLIFEKPDAFNQTGVDFDDAPEISGDKLGGINREGQIGLAGLSEPETIRHYTRLSRMNYAIDMGFYPLGSCTMKHNPRLNERVARLPGMADVHPLQPVKTAQGALQVIYDLHEWLVELTGLPAIAMSPAAGAHGELCGMMAIRSALEAKGDKREIVLVPESAHGTNPATAALCGYKIQSIPCDEFGRVELGAFKEALNDRVAALMLTNPNTCGLFETDILEISKELKKVGAFFYCDGANFNAIVGRVRPGDLGIDCMHMNLHKTFSTPHGGGGPGSGPVTLSAELAPYAPVPIVVKNGDQLDLIEHVGETKSFGRMKGFHGQMGMFVRALSYMMSHGADGLRQVAEDAVLNANYVLASLKDVMSPAYEGSCMHECLFDDKFLKDTGVSTLDFSKAMIDEGYHPMTMYFPLVVHGAMLIEPTETESKEKLDEFIAAMRHLAEKAKAGETDFFAQAPVYSPRRRLDETLAARQPVLRWSKDS